MLLFHYTFQGKTFPPSRAFPLHCVFPPGAVATGGEKIVEAMQPGESPRVWGRQPRYRPVWHDDCVSSPNWAALGSGRRV